MASADSTIAWRRRTDLVARAQSHGWVLKDPVSLRYFKLGPEEYFIWSRLTGKYSITELCREFSRQFSPRILSMEELQQFVMQLVQQGLVWGENLGTGAITSHRRAAIEGWQQWELWTNVLAIRCRGVNPDRWLTTWLPGFRCLISPAMLFVQMLCLISAFVLLATHYEVLVNRISAESAAWTVSQLATFSLALAGLKILHELGHALTCKHFGGDVRELGVMFLVFTPCLYCNVSDAWLLPSRWQRMAISLAGIWVESVVAAMALWLWWFSEPGWFHTLCLQLVLISTVSTLAFNLNPLLRYDGYFLLCDAWEKPNLQQTAAQHFGRFIKRWFWQGSESNSVGVDWALVAYFVAAFVYRLAMVGTILWVLYHWLEPQGLRVVALGIMAVTLTTLMLIPIHRLRVWWQRRNTEPASWHWPSWRVVPFTLLLVLILFWPWPQRVHTPAVLMPRDSQALYVIQSGSLQELLPPGTEVQADDVVARLQNRELERELARVRGTIAAVEQEIEGLQRRRVYDPRAALQLPTSMQKKDAWQRQLRELEKNSEHLIVRAPCDGIYWPAPARPISHLEGQLPFWSGELHDPKNLGSYLVTGTHLGWIGSAEHWQAVAYVSQSQYEQLTQKSHASVVADLAPDSDLTGEVAELSMARLSSIDPAFQQRLKLPFYQHAQGVQLAGDWYQVRIDIAGGEMIPLVLASSQLSISAPPASLLQRLNRWLHETFAFVR